MYHAGMTRENERGQHDRVRERFTRTAEQFASFALSERRDDVDQLVAMVAARATDSALDVACGPGTFTLPFAQRLRMAVGLDLTPALLAQGHAAAARAGITNVFFALGDAVTLPFAANTFDIVSCGYSLHHMADPAVAACEFARVVRPGGRVAVVDVIVPSLWQSAANNAIERARDASHERTLEPDELLALLEAAGLQAREKKPAAEVRSFNRWMSIAGWKPGDEAYQVTRRLMEDSMDGDTAGFHPRRLADADDDIIFVHSAIFVVAEKA